ncbi:hypothetical protein ACTMTJ_29440 [Phytohabitans sp. LJ34]|uniref:hypothetical protein n=1 Tax=Phytohabitans sp. LJ34 TaxID=3452217 RepID=UPI003F892533
MTTNTASIVSRAQLRSSVQMVVGYWAIMIPVYAAIVIAIVTAGDTDVSIWATSGGSAPKYFLLAVGVMLTTVHLPVYVGNGVTRRDFAYGASIFILVVAGLYAVLMTLGYVFEYSVYSAADLMGNLADPYPVRSVGDGLTQLVAEFFVAITYLCCGWLMSTCFYRFGTWWGIVLIPVTLLPAVVTEMGFDSLWAGYAINNGLGVDRPPLPAGVLMAAAAIAAAWFVNFALIRAVAIKKVSG